MKNPFPFPVKFSAVTDSMTTLHDFLKTSYKEQKALITESVAFFKDLAQIDEEFRQELTKKNEYCICIEGEMLTEKDILSRPMEENY
jgi:hypothetical protein